MESSWWWWIAEAILAAGVIPVVVLFANRVVRPALEIRRYASDVLERATGLLGELEALEDANKLGPYFEKANEVTTRYAAGVRKLA